MASETVIRSHHNPTFKQIRSLLRRERRHKERAFLVEGPRYISDALTRGASPALICFSESFATSRRFDDWSGLPRVVIDDRLFGSISDTVTSQGVVAVFPFPSVPPLFDRQPLVLIVDGVQDPGNLGTLIRSAAGAGASEVIVLPGTADPWAPKTVRAAAAAHFLISISLMTVQELAESRPPGQRLFATDAGGEVDYADCDLTGSVGFIVGSEGMGLSERTSRLAPVRLSIPLESKLESLNAAVAGAIVLFEASRQRRTATKPAKSPVSI